MSLAEQILEEFASAAKPPSGRRHFDTEAGAVAPFQAQPGRDWSDFVAERQDRRGPDDCWPWRGGCRVDMDKGGKKHKGKRPRPARAIEFRRLVWMVTRPDEALPRFVYAACGDSWCSNPRHLTNKVSERPKRKMVIVSAKSSARVVPSLHAERHGATVPIVKVENWHQDEVHTASSALSSIIQTLGVLSDGDRRRVLAAIIAFHAAEA